MINNTEYWKNIPANEIIGRNAFPGKALFEKLPSNASILDLGCGTGEAAEFLAKQGYKVTGIDINLDAINLNKIKSSKIKYLVGDITKKLPFKNDFFDGIIISFVLVNLISLSIRKKLIMELKRILKSNGVIWINEALISKEYSKRYKLCKLFLKDNHDFFVFKDKNMSSLIKNTKDLQLAINKGMVARIAHHFTIKELKTLFKDFKLIFQERLNTFSPRTNYLIKMIIMIFKKID